MHNLLHPYLLLAFALFAKTSLATDHYIDASLGNDTWSGTYPEPRPIGCDASGCTDGPKQSLVASNQGELLPGDRVFLRCGQTWRDALSVVNSGTIGAPIVFAIGAGTTLSLMVGGIPLTILPQKIFSGLAHFPYLAVPLFVLAGMLMETGGISKRIVD